MQVELPSNLNTFIGYMEQVHAFGSIIPNAFKYLVPESLLLQRNKYFRERGYNTNIALYLCGSDLEMILLQLLLVPIVSILRVKTKIKFLKAVYKKVRFNMVIRTTIVMYVRIMMALMINIANPTIGNVIEIVNFVITLLLFIAFVVAPVIVSILFRWKHYYISKRITYTDYCGPFNTLLPIADKKIYMHLNFYPIFLLKRALFAATMVMLTNFLIV